jgi:hypothetical protein
MSYIIQDNDLSTFTTRFKNLREYIILSLGGEIVRVEMSDRHLNMAIQDALIRYFERAVHPTKVEVVTAVNNIAVIPTTINPMFIENVIFETNMTDTLSKGLFFNGNSEELQSYVLPYSSFTNFLDNFDMANYYMYLSRLEDFRKMVGVDRLWDIIGEEIHLYPKQLTYNNIGIVYKAVKSDREYENTTWIRDWALAKAKHTLGTIRAKMSGFSVSSGGNLGADAESLKSEAVTEMADLMTKLDLLQGPLGFFQN